MPNFQNKASIAYAQTFFEARRRLPNSVLQDLWNFTEKFLNDPTSRGLNYEKLVAIDPNLRSARVNRNYRAIIRIPSEGAKNVYTLLWVDSHDEAYDWASRKRIDVDPVTSAVAIYDVTPREEIEETPQTLDNPKKLFEALSNEDLRNLGIPDESLFIVRTLEKEEDLENIKRFLPNRAYENLSFLVAGFHLEEVLEMVSQYQAAATDEGSFEDAIQSNINKDSFFVVESEEGANELKDILENPLDQWRVFLHPLQRNVVERNYSGPAKITGGAGTGKTIVAMHRAKWLAKNVYTHPSDRILFTTFTSNLAEDISVSLKKICTPETFSKIEVKNLDKWISEFLSRSNTPERLIYGDEVKGIWENAINQNQNTLNLPTAFYMDEYEKVILASGITSFEEYRSANRQGRGIPLNRSQKVEVWNIVEAYLAQCNRDKLIDGSRAAILAKSLLNDCHEGLYKAVIVDEAQDFGAPSFKLLRALAGAEHENDLFIVGDAHQRIYGKKVILKDCGINVTGRSGKLKINYRTTEEIRKFAQRIIDGLPLDDLDDGIDEGKGYLSLTHGKEPIVQNFNTEADEHAEIYETIRRWQALNTDSKSICITARTNRQLENIRRHLNNKGIRTYEIKNNRTDEKSMEGVRIATMHRVKGLEFDCVIVAGVNEGVIPLKAVLDAATDPVNKREAYDAERSLLYVAITRAKREVVITSSGRQSGLLG